MLPACKLHHPKVVILSMFQLESALCLAVLMCSAAQTRLSWLVWSQSCVAQGEGLKNIIQLVAGPEAQARSGAMWALAHLVNDAAPAVCEEVMTQLSWEQFCALAEDADPAVQASLLHLCCSDTLCQACSPSCCSVCPHLPVVLLG